MLMLAIAWITWWYGAGWKQLVMRIGAFAAFIIHTFSVPILIKTLFAPWRRIISYDDESFVASLRAGLDNLISRCVGFFVRLLVILTSIIALTIILVVGLITIILWPILPFLGVFLMIRGML